jgi:transposase
MCGDQAPNKQVWSQNLNQFSSPGEKMKLIVGVDVGKYELVIYLFGKCYTITNEARAINDFLKTHLSAQSDTALVVFEATGGYENILRDCLIRKNYAYHMAHPNKVRHFAKSKGYLAKTDRIDAEIIAEYGQANDLKTDPPLQDEAYQRLKALLVRREQLIDERTQDNNRQDKNLDKLMLSSIKRHIKWINKEIQYLEKQIKQHVQGHPELKKQVDLYSSVPGVGQQTAMMMIVHLPELGKTDSKQLAALSGLAPMNNDSGKYRGKRRIMAGRSNVRKALYMATLTATRSNSLIKDFYHRLIARGKPFKVAMTASMRKLLLILNSVSKRQAVWANVL